jgi:hypothetical protein
MQAISDQVDKIMASVQKQIFKIIDGIIPGLMDFLDALSEAVSYVVGISQTFSGANQIASFALQVQSYTNQLGNFLQNPLDLLTAYAPPQVSQGLYALHNPESVINQYLPPQLSQGFATLSKLTGFGFNGNMGYGLKSVLDGMKDGVISGIVKNYAAQYSVLSPLLNMAPGDKAPATNEDKPAALKPSAVNPNIQVAQGIPQLQTPPKKVMPTTDTAGANPLSAPLNSANSVVPAVNFNSLNTANSVAPAVNFSSLNG